jgi:hypothetical protein
MVFISYFEHFAASEAGTGSVIKEFVVFAAFIL